jgi:hypothetical protein
LNIAKRSAAQLKAIRNKYLITTIAEHFPTSHVEFRMKVAPISVIGQSNNKLPLKRTSIADHRGACGTSFLQVVINPAILKDRSISG